VKPLTALGAVAAGALAWGHFEAGWLRTRVRPCPVEGLPPGLDGLRVAHLSDFHLGVLGRGPGAVRRGAAWVEERRPELVCVTGDLLSRPRAEGELRALVRRLGHPYVVLGNHDVAVTRDPLSRSVELEALEGATLLGNEAVALELRGRRVQLVGVDPRSWRSRARPAALADPEADLRILLCHFPDVVDRIPPGSFDLVLAGHLHGGQICIPTPRGKVRLEHLRAPLWEGLFRLPAGAVHVSRGLGTSFVPFRFLARPEATILTLRARE
jgi:predicted MPP superfamily phosphohydrolase